MSYQQNQYSGHHENNFGTKDILEPVFNFTYSGNHALAFSLVKRITTVQQKIDYKDKLFFFITIAPGIVNGTDRTYDYKTGRITQKFSVKETLGLAKTIECCALGQDNLVLPYSKFTKSSNTSKTLSIWMGTKKTTVNNQQIDVRVINLSFFSGQLRHTLNISIADALGLSEYIMKICSKSIDLEFEFQNSGVSLKNPTLNQNTNQNNNFTMNPMGSPNINPINPGIQNNNIANNSFASIPF